MRVIDSDISFYSSKEKPNCYISSLLSGGCKTRIVSNDS